MLLFAASLLSADVPLPICTARGWSRSRQSLQLLSVQTPADNEAAAASAPPRRAKRHAAEHAAIAQQQDRQQEQPRLTRSIRRSQQQHQDGTAAETAVPAAQASSRQRQQRSEQRQQQQYNDRDRQQQQQPQQGNVHLQKVQAAAAEDGLDDFSKDAELLHAVDALGKAAADPAYFLQPNTDIAQAARQTAKVCLLASYKLAGCV